MLIGITGIQGSGKSVTSKFIQEKYNFNIIEGDAIAHEVLTLERFNEVLSWFGYSPREYVDRKFLGSLLFTSDVMNKRYNDYIYTFVKEEIDKIIASSDNKNFIIDWNYLPITPLMQECDFTILMKASKETRLNRVKNRDNIQDEYFEAREKAGLTYNDEDYDFVFINEDLNDLHDNIQKTLGVKLWK